MPAGTVEPGETFAAAALREATEETGLVGLVLVSYLGERWRDMRDFGKAEVQHRCFYHLRCTQPPPRHWRHTEMFGAEGATQPPIFAFFWVALPDGVPPLIADQDALLPMLNRGGDDQL
ncbi:MAG: NUDIX domain-containing protein [Ktedonobacterales bacterium]|nr:NUDIX domain-containing protein [Ktedonobacterales bacterium]